jgi:protein-disulfide isomerase
MLENPSGRSNLIAALLISLSIIGGSFFIANSLDRATAQIELATGKLGALPTAAAAGPNARPARGQRPDPSRDYEIDIGDAPTRGNEHASVTIVEWSDFQCPFCNRVAPTLAKVEEEYGSKVRVVFKHLPLSIHSKAPGAHAAAEAAHRQGKFWEMHDKIFASQRDLAVETFERYAQEIGLDVDQFKKDVASADVKKTLDEDMQQAQKLGVSGTPAFFINGRFISGAQPIDNFKRTIDSELAKKS